MSDIAIDSRETADDLLTAVGDQLGFVGTRYELVVVGGAALLALGLISRATRDIDLVGLKQGEAIIPRTHCPSPGRRVPARGSRLPLAGPVAQQRSHLAARPRPPRGFVGRLHRRDYGPALTVYFASRVDQIQLKLYALVDQGPGKHEDDLRALAPTREELLAGARWSRTHDPSEGYRSMLLRALAHLGVGDADVGD